MAKLPGMNRKLWIGVIVVIMLSQGALFALGAYQPRQSNASTEMTDRSETAIAADISNLTGASTARILEMRASGQSWNEILEQLKIGNGVDGNDDDREARSRRLLTSGLGEDAIRKFAAAGYAEEAIWQAKLLAERTGSQLAELTEPSTGPAVAAPLAPTADAADPANREDAFFEALRNVAEQFDLETAVSLMLSLQAAFGSYEAVLDEYLAALQLGLDLWHYEQDRQQYEQDKARLRAALIGSVEITLAEIERRILDRISQANASAPDKQAKLPLAPSGEPTGSAGDSPLPEVPLPAIEDVKPRNPADAIREELDRLNPNVSIPH